MIACKTTIGFGLADQAGNQQGARRGVRRRRDRRRPEEVELALRAVRDSGRHSFGVAGRGRAQRFRARGLVEEARGARTRGRRNEFERRISGELPKDLDSVIDAYKKQLAEQAPEIATRKAGEAALNVIAPAVPELVTGSADLTPSNNTKVAATKEITPEDFSGRYIHWGIREHGMAAACNGIAVHGGIIPSGASFLCFTDYAARRSGIAALMKSGSCMCSPTTRSGLARTGRRISRSSRWPRCAPCRTCISGVPPTASRRSSAGRPRSNHEHSPSILALTRQSLPALRKTHVAENLSARGGYEIAPAEGSRRRIHLRFRVRGLARRDAQAILKGRGSQPASFRFRAWTRSSTSPRTIAAP